MAKKWLVCDQCSIVVTDKRTGAAAIFSLGKLSLNTEGYVDELVGSDDRGLGYRVALTAHEKPEHPETQLKKGVPQL